MELIFTQSRCQDAWILARRRVSHNTLSTAQVNEELRTEDHLQPLTMIKVESEGHLRPSHQQRNLGNKYIGEFNRYGNIDQNINIIFENNKIKWRHSYSQKAIVKMLWILTDLIHLDGEVLDGVQTHPKPLSICFGYSLT